MCAELARRSSLVNEYRKCVGQKAVTFRRTWLVRNALVSVEIRGSLSKARGTVLPIGAQSES